MKRTTTLLLVLVLSLSTSGCELVGDILELGLWMMVILGLVVFGGAWLLFRAIARKGNRRSTDRTPPPSDRTPPPTA